MPVRSIKPGYLNTTSATPSKTLNRRVDAESSLERDFLFFLDKHPDAAWYEEQPITIRYVDHAHQRQKYTPDVLVQWAKTGGESAYVLYEVKFRQDLQENWAKLKPKFKAAIQVCKDKGWRFKILTEKEIRTPYFRNLEFLHHFSRTQSPVESEMRQAIDKALGKLKVATIEDVIAFMFSDLTNQMSAYPVLWRMIGDGTLEVDLTTPLTKYTEISIREEQ